MIKNLLILQQYATHVKKLILKYIDKESSLEIFGNFNHLQVSAFVLSLVDALQYN